MLGIAEASSPKDRPGRDSDEQTRKHDPAAEFIHDLAESGTANELSTVKAASDAVEGDAREANQKARRPKRRPK